MKESNDFTKISKFRNEFDDFEKQTFSDRKDIIDYQLQSLIESLSNLEYRNYKYLFEFPKGKYLNRIILYQICEKNLKGLKISDALNIYKKEYNQYNAKNFKDDKSVGSYSGMPLNYSLKLILKRLKNKSEIAFEELIDIKTKSISALNTLQKHPNIDTGNHLKTKYKSIIQIVSQKLPKQTTFKQDMVKKTIELLLRRRGLIGILSLLFAVFVGQLTAISNGEDVVELCNKIQLDNPSNWKFYAAQLGKIFFGKGNWVILGITSCAITLVAYILLNVKNTDANNGYDDHISLRTL